MQKINGIELNDFAMDYIVCALWSSSDDDGIPLDSNFDITDLNELSLKEMVADCNRFETENSDLLNDTPDDYDMGQAGHDFWLTRNGHGAGFWDRDLLEIGDKLTEKAHSFGESNILMGDDGKLFVA